MIEVRTRFLAQWDIHSNVYRDADNERFHDASWDTDIIFTGQMLRILQRVSFFRYSPNSRVAEY